MSANRCNYCNRDAVVRFMHLGYLAATRRKWFRSWVRACAEHEGNPNWASVLESQREKRPEVQIERWSARDQRWRAT